jgi:hypothetical protein
VLVEDIYPGSLGSYPTSFAVSGGHLFFSADDGIHGAELWDPPILPPPETDTVPATRGISGWGDRVPLSVVPDEGDAAAVVLSTAGIGWIRQCQDATHWLADDPVRSASVPEGKIRPADILDQVFTEAVRQPQNLHLGLALPPDLLLDLAPNCFG